jgi:Mannitol-1-phosphate/altronate dehydrogenases
MPVLSKESIKSKAEWEKAGIRLPGFDYDAMCARTRQSPRWVHIGPGNIFRGFIAALQQKILESGKADSGIVAVGTFDNQVIDQIYVPYDNLALQVVMYADGSLDKTVIASIAESLKAEAGAPQDWKELQGIFSNPSLQMVSFTVTEKGYQIQNMDGAYYPDVVHDFEHGPEMPKNGMAIVTSLLYTRFLAGRHPVAMVSMDNFSHNGDKLFGSVITVAKKWCENGFTDPEFLDYLQDRTKVSFPWSMIDKITPRPSEQVSKKLKESGFENTDLVITDWHTYIAPFVNTEAPQYLVIEDCFPNGRMPLEEAGVYFTDRKTVDMTERMKVCTCLNPLHTAMAVFGCLLGYDSIAAEMKDPCIAALVNRIGYREGMPVVTDPGILNPSDFLKEVIEVRLPNPFIPDTPQRIATDTSQKLSIRFGETIKCYLERDDLDVRTLTCIPLTIAAWCRYLLGVDDKGQPLALSADPLLEQLQSYTAKIVFGDPSSVVGSLRPILSNERIFGVDLYEAGLGEKVEDYFKRMIAGENAVRETLKQAVLSE